MDKNTFLKKYNINNESFDKTSLRWEDLLDIKNDYELSTGQLELVARDIADRLRKSSESVHSVKFRVKNSEHLIEKIIRKKIENNNRKFNLKNYKNEITDLIGVRVLHLFKDNWKDIHDFIVTTWETSDKPIAFYREGDSETHLTDYKNNGCKQEKHKYGYRSVHYLVKTSPTKNLNFVEIQVRTLFEEAWSEIDHKIRYPYDQENILLKPYLVLFNRLAGNADEMGSYVKVLQNVQIKHETDLQSLIEKHNKKVSEIQKLSLQTDKNNLFNDLNDLKLDINLSDFNILDTSIPSFESSLSPNLNLSITNESLLGSFFESKPSDKKNK